MAMLTEKQKKDWLTNLRSGEYRRGKNKLCRITGSVARYCVLGVLYETIRGEDAWVVAQTLDGVTDLRPPGGTSVFWHGGLITGKDVVNLTSKNDSGWSFRRLANWIAWNVPVVN